MYCPYCGTQISDNARFCKFCGGKISSFPGKEKQHSGILPIAGPETLDDRMGVQPGSGFEAAPFTPAQPVYKPAQTTALQPSVNGNRAGSYMQTFRLVSGLMFLAEALTSVLSNVVYYTTWPESIVVENVLAMIVSLTFVSLLPGIASIILKKPDKRRSIVLTVLLGVSVAVNLFLTALGLVSYLNYTFYTTGYALYLGFTNINLPLILCFIVALISIRQPECLTGAPRPVMARGWKIVSGILHLLCCLAGTVAFIIIFSIWAMKDEQQSSYSLASSASGILYLSFVLAAAGIMSVMAGAGKREADFSVIYTGFLLFQIFVYTIGSMIASLANSGIFLKSTSDAEMVLSLGLVLLTVLWGLACFLIALITFLKRRKNP